MLNSKDEIASYEDKFSNLHAQVQALNEEENYCRSEVKS